MKRNLLALISFAVFCASALADGVSVAPVPDLAKDFIMGADVSMLGQLESSGVAFLDEKGKPGDCLAILKSGGVNWIRLRIWNDPVNREDVVEGGRVLSRAGDPVGGGNDDLAAYVRIAKRAKKLGLKVCADFHYSDFWADPSKQTMPFAWRGLGLDALAKAVYDFTSSSLKTMRTAGAAPDLVQVGNEVDNGFLWPVGKLWSSGDEVVGGEEGFVALLKEAISAVRDNDRRIRVMIHASNGGDNALYRKLFDPLVKAGVDFDVIGISFYPYWHGKISDLVANMADLETRYGKQLIVAETAYAWTLENGDSLENSFGPGSEKLGGYKATVQGQATAIRDIIAAVAGTPKSLGIGIFYWEPDWIPVARAGWRTGDGEVWENQAMFDFHGKALPSLKVFKLVVLEQGHSRPLPRFCRGREGKTGGGHEARPSEIHLRRFLRRFDPKCAGQVGPARPGDPEVGRHGRGERHAPGLRELRHGDRRGRDRRQPHQGRQLRIRNPRSRMAAHRAGSQGGGARREKPRERSLRGLFLQVLGPQALPVYPLPAFRRAQGRQLLPSRVGDGRRRGEELFPLRAQLREVLSSNQRSSTRAGRSGSCTRSRASPSAGGSARSGCRWTATQAAGETPTTSSSSATAGKAALRVARRGTAAVSGEAAAALGQRGAAPVSGQFYIQNRRLTPSSPVLVLTLTPFVISNAMMYESPTEIGPSLISAPAFAFSPSCVTGLLLKL